MTTDDSQAVFQSIPIIDLSNISSPDPKLRRALADEVRNACINVGFFYVKNHGIPEQVISDTHSMAEKFFALPDEVKMEMDGKKFQTLTGYHPLLSSNNDPNGAGDLQEGFEFGWEELSDAERPANGSADEKLGSNVWPTQIPRFRESVLQYYHAAVKLGRSLFPIFALALDLSEDFFEDKIRHSAALMKLLHYPPQTGPVDERVVGIGAHTDWECFTILWQQPGIQALQVLNSDKKWIDATPIPGTFVVNLGDQFARWTNDRFKSTVHRAINRSGVERYSIPLFFGTDYDVPLEPIPGCTSETNPYKYEVIKAGDYVKARFEAAYNH